MSDTIHYKISYDSYSGCTTIANKSKVAKCHSIVECIGTFEELIAELELINAYIHNDTIDKIIVELHKLLSNPIKTIVIPEIIKKPDHVNALEPITKAYVNRCVAVCRRTERRLAELKVYHYDVSESALIFMDILSKYLHDLIV
jgi:cob(I)alamin adenosyltransferase